MTVPRAASNWLRATQNAPLRVMPAPAELRDELVSVTGIEDVAGNRWIAYAPTTPVPPRGHIDSWTALCQAFEHDYIPFRCAGRLAGCAKIRGAAARQHAIHGARAHGRDLTRTAAHLRARSGSPAPTCADGLFLDWTAHATAMELRPGNLALLRRGCPRGHDFSVPVAGRLRLEDVSSWRFLVWPPVHGDIQERSLLC